MFNKMKEEIFSLNKTSERLTGQAGEMEGKNMQSDLPWLRLEKIVLSPAQHRERLVELRLREGPSRLSSFFALKPSVVIIIIQFLSKAFFTSAFHDLCSPFCSHRSAPSPE
jgi:hypothetical protein